MKSFLVALASNLVFLAVLLASAGRLTYAPAWVYFAIGSAMNVSMRWILREDPALALERSKPGPGAEDWDKKLLGIGLLLTLATLVVAGLDAGRFHGSPRLGWPWLIAGAAMDLVGMALFLWALRENRFFSAVVRIQSDRGHAVCTSGPYRIVRHPGNLGMIVGTLGLPALLMSAWSAVPVALSVAVLVVRTRLEDAMLQNELEGYRAYASATRYRLVPGIW